MSEAAHHRHDYSTRSWFLRGQCLNRSQSKHNMTRGMTCFVARSWIKLVVHDVCLCVVVGSQSIAEILVAGVDFVCILVATPLSLQSFSANRVR